MNNTYPQEERLGFGLVVAKALKDEKSFRLPFDIGRAMPNQTLLTSGLCGCNSSVKSSLGSATDVKL